MKEQEERFSAPDLIIIDGGKGQLSAVAEVFKDLGVNDIELISLAKKQEEIFTLNAEGPIVLAKNDYCLRLLQRIRDEAHRFAITYHRTLRQKRSFFSQLNEIEGLGKKKINALLVKFGSVAEIAAADIEELKSVEGIGEKHAQRIYSYFHEKGEL
jgi:excinuclease ABC subunit C